MAKFLSQYLYDLLGLEYAKMSATKVNEMKNIKPQFYFKCFALLTLQVLSNEKKKNLNILFCEYCVR